MTDIIIIGAGCAGMTAAVYAARAGKSVLVIEGEGIGGQIASSPRVENYPGISSISGIEFSDSLCEQAQALGAAFDFAEATGIRSGNAPTVLTDGGELACKSIIIASGTRHRELGLPHERELSGISYCAICDGAFYRGKDVAVVGGGSAALQSAVYLAGICRSVTLIHRRNAFRGEAALAEEAARIPNIRLALSSTVTALGGSEKLSAITVKNLETEKEQTILLSGLFILVGQKPRNTPFEGQVKLDEDGYILAGEDCLTNAPGVFAAGDCRRKKVRQLTTAAGDGAVAALAACRWADEH